MRKRYSIEIVILSNNIVHKFKQNNLILDMYENKEIYKKEKILDIFKDEFALNGIQSFKILDFKCSDIDNVEVKIDGQYLVISSIKFNSSNKLLYTLFVNKSSIRIDMDETSSNIRYNISVTDGDHLYTKDYIDAIEYEYINKTFTFTITMYVFGNIVSKHTRTITINDRNCIVNDFDPQIEKYNKSNNSVIKDGIEDIELDMKITKKEETSLFSISAFSSQTLDSTKDIYPKVTARYNVMASYKLPVEKFVGRASFIASIDHSSKHVFDILKWRAGTISISFLIESSCRYKDGIYKTTKINHTFTSSVDLNNYITINDKDRTVHVDILKAQKDIAKDKSIKELLTIEATRRGITGDIVFYNYTIKNCTSSSNLSGSSCASAVFETSGGDISVTSTPKIIIFPGACIYTGHKVLSFSNINSSKKVIDAALVDSIKGHNQNSEEIDCTNYKIYHIDGDSSYDISGKDVMCHPLSNSSIQGTIELSKDIQSKYVSLGTYNSFVTASVVVTAITDININSTFLSKGETLTLNLSSYSDGLSFFAKCHSYFVDEDFESQLIEESCFCNGVTSTFDTDLKGKEDFTSSISPVHVPYYAKDIVISTNVTDIYPKDAESLTTIVFKTGDNIESSATITMSSSYTSKIASFTKETFLQIFNGIMIGQDESRTLNLTIPCDNDGPVNIVLTSDDPSVHLEYSKNNVVENGSCSLLVTAFKSISKNSKWNISMNPFYLYNDALEYFTYNNSIASSLLNGSCTLNFIPDNTTDPICIVSDGTNLTRVISNCTNGISIEEKLYCNMGVVYTKYNNIVVESVKSCDGVDIDYTSKENCIVTKYTGEVHVIYKVKDSFDYKFIDGKTIIKSSINFGEINIYIPKDITPNIDINPLNSLITSGYIYIEKGKSILQKCIVEEYIMPYGYMYFINCYDEFDNLYKESVTINNIAYTNYNVIAIKSDIQINHFTVSSDNNTVDVNRKEFIGHA